MGRKPKDQEDEDLKPCMPRKILERFEELPEDWKQVMYDLALEGESDSSLHTALALTRRKHESLAKHHTEYREWFEYCHEVSLSWWERFGKKVCLNKNYNGATYNLIMQNKTANMRPTLPEQPGEEPETQTLDDFKRKITTEEPAAEEQTQLLKQSN